MTGIIVVFVLILVASAFGGGAYLCYQLFEPQINAAAEVRQAATVQAQVDALKVAHQIDEASWLTERAMLREALRLDRPEDGR